MADLASIITAIAALIAAIGAFTNSRKISEVKTEVKTGNSLTIAELIDAVETRRIRATPKAERTPLENSHLKDTK